MVVNITGENEAAKVDRDFGMEKYFRLGDQGRRL